MKGTIEARFWAKVEKRLGGECWEWQAYLNPKGYGQIGVGPAGAGMLLAHRYSWMLHMGPIPDGFDILHFCDNPRCVNPLHLRLGNDLENCHEMIAKGRGRWWNTGKTHCIHGHEFTPENTIIRPCGKARTCRQCYDKRSLAWRERNRERLRLYTENWRAQKRASAI